MKLDNNLNITQSYLYNPYGDVYKSQDTSKEHPSWLSKTKDMESNLNDHGVRKYDGFAHRFTAPDEYVIKQVADFIENAVETRTMVQENLEKKK